MDLRDFYKVYTIYRNRKPRQIEEPMDELLVLQKNILKFLTTHVKLPECATSVEGKSVVVNARVHENASHLLKMDIEHFYQNVNQHHLLGRPFVNEDMLLACMLQKEEDGNFYLPTGAPTSPFLSNMSLMDFDERILIYLSSIQGKYRYTRYIDDLTFSSIEKEDNEVIEGIVNKVTEELEKLGFRVKKKKTEVIRPNMNQEFSVTGVCLSDGGRSKYKVPLKIRRKIRTMLHKSAIMGQSKETFCDELKGYLSYVSSIDKSALQKLMADYNKSFEKFNDSRLTK